MIKKTNAGSRDKNKEFVVEDLALFLNLFKGRKGVFARQWFGGKGYSPVRPEREIIKSDIVFHLQGLETYGVFPVKHDNTTRLICFDIDLPRNFAAIGEEGLIKDKSSLLPQVCAICAAASGILQRFSNDENCLIVEDTGGRGYHVWMFFDPPIASKDARKFAHIIVNSANVQCEIFPKQSKVDKNQYGNLIKLPLGLHRKYKRYSNFIEIKDNEVLLIEDPLSYLHQVSTIPKELVLQIVKIESKETITKAVELKEISPTNKETIRKKEMTGDQNPEIGDLFDKCRVFSCLKEKSEREKHLKHEERLALAYVLINIDKGEKILHKLLRNCTDYKKSRTQKEIDYLKAREMKPISCRRLIEQGICKNFCRSEILEQSMDPERSEPSPIRFALWQEIGEPELLWKMGDVNYENVYKRSNLFRAWAQIKEYARENEAFFDMQAYEEFEEHLEENIETIRFELRSKSFSPSPFRRYFIPKSKKGEDYEYRKMAFLEPRDYVVIQAVINIIGNTFEREFLKDSCISYRLDSEGTTGNSIFFNWQSAWQIRKRKITGFLFNPDSHHYIKADISQFYDHIDRVRLYKLILDKIGFEHEICAVIKMFLENNYIVNNNGNEEIRNAPPSGIPQGPAFSPFFANIYLNELDHLIAKKAVNYVRYVDDMVILCENRDESIEMYEFLEESLASIDLELNKDKSSAPCSVTNSEPLLDFLGEIKYGMAGLFSRQPYPQMILSSKLLQSKLDELLNIKELDIYNLEEIAKNLSYYLRMKEKIKPGLDGLAIGLSKKTLREYALKPHHILIILRVLIRNEIDIREVVSDSTNDYLKIVLSLLLMDADEMPPWAEDILKEFAKDKTSYILRATAFFALSKLDSKACEDEMLKILPKEESEYVIEKSLYYLLSIGSDLAKMCFFELMRKHLQLLLGAFLNIAIKWSNSMLDNLIGNQMEKIEVDQTVDLFSILEFIFIICPANFEILLVSFFSSKHRVLIHELVSSSMGRIEMVASKRGYISLVHRDLINEKIRKVKVDWLRNTLLRAFDEWKIGTLDIGKLRDINNWLTGGDPSKIIRRESDLATKEHKKQGGYQSWVVTDDITKDRFVIEGIEEDILDEQNVIGNGITPQDIKRQLEENNLSTIVDVFGTIEGGRKYIWFKYRIPEGYSILSELLRLEKIDPKLEEQEILNVISSLFYKVECIRRHIGVESVVNPFTVLLGEGNQVRLINLFFGFPRKLYASSYSRSLVDSSTSTNSLFNGLLAFELFSSKCPIEYYKKVIKSEKGQLSQSMSKFLDDGIVSVHFTWILDRLCNVSIPQFRYSNLSTLKNDIRCLKEFRKHFQNSSLSNLPFSTKYWAESLSVINLRISRYLKLPSKVNYTIHEKLERVFRNSIYYFTRTSEITNQSIKIAELIPKRSLSAILHEAGYKCDLFATKIFTKIKSIRNETNWKISESIPLMILYLAFKLEIVALGRAIGLFKMYKSDKIKNAILCFAGSSFAINMIIKEMELEDLIDTNRAVRLLDLLNCLYNKRFQRLINSDVSEFTLLILFVIALLTKKDMLWKNWSKSLGISIKINLSRTVSILKHIAADSIKIDRLMIVLMRNPLNTETTTKGNLLKLFNSCLKNVMRLHKMIKLRRKRTIIIRSFLPYMEKLIAIKVGRKEMELSHNLILPFPPIHKMIWKNAAATCDLMKLFRKNRITAISLTPTDFVPLLEWKYECTAAKVWKWMRKNSKGAIWKLGAIGLFGGGVISFFFGKQTIGTILLMIGALLLAPLVQELYVRIFSVK